jgi:glycosyltransferase involved in cell wall biosynthesis
MLRQHLASNRPDFRQRAVVVFESSDRPDAIGLELRGWHSPHVAQERWKQRVSPVVGCASYLNGWGAGFFAPLDGCERRLAVLATAWPGDRAYLTALKNVFDFVMTVSQPLAELARETLDLPPDRVAVIPVPISLPILPPRPSRPWHERPLVLGYCGRLITAQKRVERLPRIAEALLAAGIPHRWEILGDGPVRDQLAGQFASVGATAQFRGRLSGEAYWHAIRELDFIVFTSDYEGTPLSLAEAMSQGVLPLYAQMNSGGDEYARQIHPDLLFPVDDWDRAVRGVRAVLASTADEREAMQVKAREIAQHHANDAYVKLFEVGARRAWAMPRISQPRPAPAGMALARRLPFAVIDRLSPEGRLRRGIG